MLKKGRSYKTGHYHYGYWYYSYDTAMSKIKLFTQDLSLDYTNPRESTEYLDEEEYIEELMKQNYDDVLKAF